MNPVKQAENVFEALEARRAVKHFDPNHQMTDVEIEKLLSAALFSPTSFNIQNWRFVHVKDPALRQKLRKAAWDQAQVTECSMVLLLCADLKSWNKDTNRYWKNAPDAVRDGLVGMIKKFYDNNPQLERDEAMRSCGIAAQSIMLAAKAMGYDSCPMIGFDIQQAAELIQLPEDHIITMMVTVGKRKEDARARGGQLPYSEVVITDTF